MNSDEIRKRHQVGSYQNEMDILQAVCNEQAGPLRVKLKPSSNELAIEVGAFSFVDQLHKKLTIVLPNHDGFKGVE